MPAPSAAAATTTSATGTPLVMPRGSASTPGLLRYAPASREKGACMADVPVTWLGHASFRLATPGGKRVYVDPWLSNPKCPDSEKEPERIDVIAITHGHGDHVGETVELSKKFEPKAVVAMAELKAWLKDQGAKVDDLPGPNKGGTVDVEGVKFTLVNAFHSSSSDEGEYLGEAAGLVITLEDGRAIYFAGDTCVFSDMQLIGRLYSPELAVLPIG